MMPLPYDTVYALNICALQIFICTSTNQKETDMSIYQHLSTHESNENNESCFFFDIVGKSVIHLFIYTL